MNNRQLNLHSNESVPAFFRVIDITLLIIALLISLTIYSVPIDKDYLLLLFLATSFFLFIAESIQLYRKLVLGPFFNRTLNVVTAVTLTSFLMTTLLFLMKENENYSRIAMLIWYILTLTSLIGWRIIYRKAKRSLYKKGINLRKVAVIGLTPIARQLAKEIELYPELGLQFVGFYDDRKTQRLKGDLTLYKGTVQDALELAQTRELDVVYICIPLSAEAHIARIIYKLSDSTVSVFMVPDFLMSSLMQGNISNIGSLDTISVFESPISGIQEFYKRFFDIIFSFIVIVLISPILLTISIAIKLTSKGPVLFKQDRYGLAGEQIKVYKFRSMKAMENSHTVVQATKNDSRITSIGGFLRRTSLDELPQFFNVLKGEMSVVGPRPHAVAHNEEYRKLVDYYMLRHKVKPGITGWAQINGLRGETDTVDKMEKRVEYDLQYIRNWTLWWDIQIIFLTVYKGFINKNAY